MIKMVEGDLKVDLGKLTRELLNCENTEISMILQIRT